MRRFADHFAEKACENNVAKVRENNNGKFREIIMEYYSSKGVMQAESGS